MTTSCPNGDCVHVRPDMGTAPVNTVGSLAFTLAMTTLFDVTLTVCRW